MEQDTSEQQDAYYDPALGMTITRSGKARWRRRLAEAEAGRDQAAGSALLDRLRQGPTAAA